MAGGIISSNNAKEYSGKMTPFMILSAILAASCGLMFGYDIGISGGVTSMDVFLKKFFPSVYKNKQAASSNQNNYCKFDSQLLTLFTSSLYITGLIGSMVASYASRRFGRKVTMLSGGAVYLVGAAINGAAYAVWMLIFGRLLLGAGIGLVIQAAPMFLSEIALPQRRGLWNSGFQLLITVGILAANVVNYFTSKMTTDSGWRISLGLAGVPGIVVFVGSFFLPETPNSLIERGEEGKALAMLKKIRGVEDVHEEFADLIEASDASKKVKNSWKAIVTRTHRPQFVITLLIPFFQQLTGINVVMFYAPVLFQTLGFKNDASLMSAAITGSVNVAATFVAFFIVDRFGRRVLFFEGGAQMLISQLAIGIVLLVKFGTKGVATLSSGWATLVVILICTYTAAFAWSWGPLGWLVPSEIFQLEIRSAGVAINASVNLFMTFVVAQAFLPALCHCYAAWFASCPGLKVLSPYSSEDARGLLKAAVRDPDAVVFLENELLYGESFPVSAEALDSSFCLPIGKAKIEREGKHVTITAFSKMVGYALQAATWLELNEKLMTHGRIMVNCGGTHAEAAKAGGVAYSNVGSWIQNSTIKALCKAFPKNVGTEDQCNRGQLLEHLFVFHKNIVLTLFWMLLFYLN